MKSFFPLLVFFYLLSLIEVSFLPHFFVWGIFPSLILISVIAFSILPQFGWGAAIFSGVAGGFFWDVFSADFLGFHVLILVGLALFIKLILKRYVRAPIIS